MTKQRPFATSWRRQIEGKGSSYESRHRTIWHDRVTKLDRQPELLAGRDVARFKRDVFGNRVKPVSKEAKARAFLQRRTAQDKEFAAVWASMTPAQCNALVERMAAQI